MSKLIDLVQTGEQEAVTRTPEELKRASETAATVAWTEDTIAIHGKQCPIGKIVRAARAYFLVLVGIVAGAQAISAMMMRPFVRDVLRAEVGAIVRAEVETLLREKKLAAVTSTPAPAIVTVLP